MSGCGISGCGNVRISLGFLVMPLSAFHWEINLMDGHRISGNATAWISV